MTIDLLTRHGAELRAELESLIPSSGPAAPLYTMLRYHLGWVEPDGGPVAANPGKLVRPTLVLTACAACGGDPARALPAAAAVELLHNFTLIHDDVQDNSPDRRHRSTVWFLWGVPHAITAGDAMFSIARLTLLRLADRDHGPATALEAAALLDQACLAICEGQYLDLEFERRLDVTEAEYLAMIERKTAALLGCSAELGAVAAGATAAERAALRRFGINLGVAFQIQDDILGTWGDPKRTGKPAADDVRSRKKTLPAVRALAGTTAASRRLEKLFAQNALTEAEVTEALSLFEELGLRADAEATAAKWSDNALRELAALPADNLYRAELERLASSLIGRAS